MIIINLKGGLGNQMFQYALGRKLSLQNGAELKLDISGYSRQNPRAYRLGDFNIAENIARPEEIKKLKYPFGIFSMIWRRFSSKILRRFYIGWEPQVLATKDGSFIDGFWNSYKYFNGIADTIKRDFTLKEPLNKTHPELLNQISSASSISLHIRRGDYVANPTHDICDLPYYYKAVQVIAEKVSSPAFFIFSDDIEWAKQNLRLDFPAIFVSSPEIKDTEELILMSHCRHNIIANSTFSWWAAWLNENENKIVVAPKKWNNTYQKYYQYLLPDNWLKI